MSKPVPEDQEYKEFQEGILAGRVYKDGRVKIGILVIDSVTPGKPRLEVEASVDTKTGRDFCERLLGLINLQAGRFS